MSTPSRPMPEPLPGEGAIRTLARWIQDAADAGLAYPNTMTFATSGPDGPHARTVLVTAVDAESLRFHSSTPTTKTVDLAADDRAAAVFHWASLGRQVILVGRAVELSRDVSRAGYLAQPRRLQVLAWVYDAILPGLTPPDNDIAVGAVEQTFAGYATDPVSDSAPQSWTTISFVPTQVDFWHEGPPGGPSAKTRFVAGPDGTWRSFPVLP